MNDPTTLDFYSRLLVFKDDVTRKVMTFPPSLSPEQRKVLHALSHYLGLEHTAVGSGEARHIQITKEKQVKITTPDLSAANYSYNDSSRRALNRAATIDFAESGVRETGHYHTLRAQNSNLLDIPASPGLGIRGQSLREAKSFGDLQSRRASPALSTSSFPANLTQNVNRYNEYGTINGGPVTTDMLPPSTLLNGRDDSFFTNFSNMSLGFDQPASSRNNGRLGVNGDGRTTNAGAIGSQRSHPALNGNFEDMRNGTTAVPERQPRGPAADWGSGFSRPRQNGHVQRLSDDLDLNDLDQNSDRTGHSSSRYM
jgi:hypothetical protein